MCFMQSPRSMQRYWTQGVVRTWPYIASYRVTNTYLGSDKTKEKHFEFLGWQIMGRHPYGGTNGR